ncbi:MAG: polyprenyl synthetase family protein [Sedimentisphaerales bacterium]|nr:polyprenyl synthetase family protein [Sedimentisphaerales bacterium]
MTAQSFDDLCRELARLVESAIEGYLAHGLMPARLQESMLYSLRAGGKRLRPITVLLACRACGGDDMVALPAAAAIEMVHTYSLIHDDLPAMDNDNLRRGKPTNHIVFGDGMAILAGDALLTSAFEVLARHIQKDRLVRLLVAELTHAAGADGMIGGQAADLLGEYTGGDLETVEYIHTHKTAMMFYGAARMGGICAEADTMQMDLLGDFGLKIGLAFQMIDDLLDVTAAPEQMGKATGKDTQAGKITYPAVIGVEQTRQNADRLLDEALETLNPLGEDAEPLKQLAQLMGRRQS